MPAKATIYARKTRPSPQDILAESLARLERDAGAMTALERADHLLAELQRHGYRIRTR